ncbi:hypothetical protein, partial [Pseudonocardia sp.]|uniref:hypothetical protein n=1 Tax=Pseudonocardia sp. TaxID=60912 RepID=UPI003D11FA29
RGIEAATGCAGHEPLPDERRSIDRLLISSVLRYRKSLVMMADIWSTQVDTRSDSGASLASVVDQREECGLRC